jgi:O-antigen/teichoic acid export membrane protein
MLKQVTLVLTILGGFFFLIIIFFGSTILSFWGEEFRSGYYILLILTFSQVYNISTGPVGTLLIMSGYEKILMKLNIYLSIFSLLLGSISAYFFGVIAFAVAAFVIRITGNSIKILLCKKNLNISMF